jgi:hypothetical protein
MDEERKIAIALELLKKQIESLHMAAGSLIKQIQPVRGQKVEFAKEETPPFNCGSDLGQELEKCRFRLANTEAMLNNERNNLEL